MFTRKRGFRVPLALTLLLLTLLTACAKPSEKEPEKPKFQGELTLWVADDLAGYPGTLEAGWISERVQGFQTAHPGVTVQVRTLGTGEELEQSLTSAGTELPDLFFGRPLPQLGDRLAQLEPLLAPESVSDLLPGSAAGFRTGDRVFGMPMLVEGQVLALNESVFQKLQVALPKDGRWTKEDFAQSLGKLSGAGLFALGFSIAPGYHEWWPLVDGLITGDQKIVPSAEAALKQLAAWRQSGQITPDIAMLSQEEAYKRFAEGRLAVLPVPVYLLPQIRRDQVPVAVAAFPGERNGGYLYGFSLRAQDDEAKLRSALALAEFVGAPDQQVRQSRKTGLLPARKSAGNPFEKDPLMTSAWQQVGSVQPLPTGPVWDQAQERIAQELLLAVTGNREPAQVLQTIQTLAATPTQGD